MEEHHHPYGIPDPNLQGQIGYHHQGVSGAPVYHHVPHMHGASAYPLSLPTAYQEHHSQELQANFADVDGSIVVHEASLQQVEGDIEGNYGAVVIADQPYSKPHLVSINLRAFNLYAARIRQQVRAEHPEFTGQEIERAIGQRWSAVDNTEREEYLEAARKERELLVKQGLADPSPPVRKKRRKPEEIEADRALMNVGKRKRGRPSKSDTLARQAMVLAAQSGLSITDPSSIAAILASHGQSAEGSELLKKPRKKKGALVGTVQGNLIGQNVHGVLDGTFDAGYFLTIRVGSTDTILRGVVFAPGVAMPLTKSNDAAPGVGRLERTPGVKFPSLTPAPQEAK